MTSANKTYILDTSVLINDPDVFYRLGRNEIVLPTAVIREVDGIKKDPDPDAPKAKAARRVGRTLDRLSSYGNMTEGVRLSSDGLLRIERTYARVEGLASEADNKIVGTALSLKNEGQRAILLTMDANMRTIARAYGVDAESPEGYDDPVSSVAMVRANENINISRPSKKAPSRAVMLSKLIYKVTVVILMIFIIMVSLSFWQESVNRRALEEQQKAEATARAPRSGPQGTLKNKNPRLIKETRKNKAILPTYREIRKRIYDEESPYVIGGFLVMIVLIIFALKR